MINKNMKCCKNNCSKCPLNNTFACQYVDVGAVLSNEIDRLIQNTMEDLNQACNELKILIKMKGDFKNGNKEKDG